MSYNVIEIGFYNEVGVNCGEGCGRVGMGRKRRKERETQEDGTLEMTRGRRQMGSKGKEEGR